MLCIFLIFLLCSNSLSHSFSFCCHYMDFLKRRSNQTLLHLIPVVPPTPTPLLPTFSSQSARKFSNNPSKCALLQPCITADSAYPEKRDKKGEICKICCSLHKTQRQQQQQQPPLPCIPRPAVDKCFQCLGQFSQMNPFSSIQQENER